MDWVQILGISVAVLLICASEKVDNHCPWYL